MSTNIIPFSYADHPVRVIQINGEPWFVPSDVCAILGHRNASQAVVQHVHADDSMRATLTIREGSRDVTRERTLVNESGLYALIFGSSLPQAVKFKRWVTHEVLPAIRRRCGYLTPEAAEQALTDPDFIIRLAIELKTERAARAELEQQQRVLTPKADAFDLWLSSNADYSVDQAAKALCTAGCMTGRTKNTGTFNRQIVRPGATTTGVFREYSAAPSITTRSAA